MEPIKSTDIQTRANSESRKRSGRKLTILIQALIFLLCTVCVTLGLGAGTARAANHTMGQLAGGKGTYSDGNTIAFGKTFTAAPVVVVNACDVAGYPLAAAATSVTTTGFTVRICDLDGIAASNATVQWIAIIPDPDNPKIKAGYGYAYDGETFNFSPAFNDLPASFPYPTMFCSAYGLSQPLLASFYSLSSSAFTAALKDMDGSPEEGTLSWIAIDASDYPYDNVYDEAVLVGNYTTYNNNTHIAYGPPISTYADADNLVILTCAQKSNMPYCSTARNNSIYGFDLSLQDYDKTAGTSVWTSWMVFGINPPGTHLVIFETNGGDISGEWEYVYTDDSNHVALPASPTRSGYHFAEWNTRSDGRGDKITASTEITEDISAYAIWTPNSCTVSFDSNGGDTDASPASKAVTNPATTVGTLPAPPTRSGYSFAGWNTEADGEGYAFTASTVITATPMTVYAMWMPDTYTVTFDKNGGDTDASPAIETVTTPATTVGALPAPPSRSGYHFAGWNAQSDGHGSPFTASTAVTGSTTVYAVWTPVYTVTFDSNGGDTDASPAAATTDINGHVSLPSTDPARSGYHFAGWNTQSDGHGSPFTASTAVTGSTTVYAAWTALTLESTAPTGHIYTGGRITLTPNVDGGEWNWDHSFFTATFNSPATFTALKAGTSTITYTVGGATTSYTVTIEKNTLPATGQDFTWVWVFIGAALAVFAAGMVVRRRRKSVNNER